jgi:cytochrome c oxidase assembly protein subunit 15
VRVSGAGLGCPDWPKCFGRWIPPLNVSQLPSDIDPLTFNFTLAWIEYFNRLTGVTIGILILITAILAIKYFRKVKKILYPSIAAALLVAYQGWQGGQVVASELEPFIVSVHMVLALIIVSLLIYVTQKAYYLETVEKGMAIRDYGGSRLAIGILWAATIFQILIGTQVRSSVETIQEKYPLLSDSAVLELAGSVNFIHTVLGVIVVLFGIYLGFKILRQKGISNLVRQCALGITILAGAQLVIGILLVVIGIPQLLQVFHLWVAAVSVGILLVLFSAARGTKGGEYAAGR